MQAAQRTSRYIVQTLLVFRSLKKKYLQYITNFGELNFWFICVKNCSVRWLFLSKPNPL